jgi:phosphoribosylamine--glycine ligase
VTPAPTRILVVGSGAREHALAWKLAAEPGVNEVAVAPGSAAIGQVARVRALAGVDPLVGAAVVVAARATAGELGGMGPEAPRAPGVGAAQGGGGIGEVGP